MTRPLDLLFLGSGNAFASGRYWSSFLLNGRYLFDASPVALPHLKRAGVSPADIEAVFISHFHADHFFGLPFLFLEYAHKTKREQELTIVGAAGLEQRVRAVTEIGFPGLLGRSTSYRQVFREVEDGTRGDVAGLKYLAREVTHVDDFPCLGYRVEIDGRTIAYSGDSTMCDALVELADGADVFVVECSCWEDECKPLHLGVENIRELRRRLGPKPVFIVTHLEAGAQDLDIENVLVADDLKRFTL